MKTPDLSTKRGVHRAKMATEAMAALIMSRQPFKTKKQLVDNAIAYADMMLRRLYDIPPEAQEACEAGSVNARN